MLNKYLQVDAHLTSASRCTTHLPPIPAAAKVVRCDRESSGAVIYSCNHESCSWDFLASQFNHCCSGSPNNVVYEYIYITRRVIPPPSRTHNRPTGKYTLAVPHPLSLPSLPLSPFRTPSVPLGRLWLRHRGRAVLGASSEPLRGPELAPRS